MIQENTGHFQIYYHSKNSSFAMELIRQTEPFYLETCQKASIPAGEDRYDLFVCASADEFCSLTDIGREYYQDWMVGNTDMSRKRLCVLALKTGDNQPRSDTDYMIRVTLHEIVHIVFNRLCDPEKCETWLAEGTALYYAGQINLSHVSETDYPLIADLAGVGNGIGFAENGGYDYAGIYVWYLIRLYGMEQFLAIYKGTCNTDGLFDNGFEQKAIAAYKNAQI